ncbi:nuclear transport factor 2 family protein [Undibacterium luofuense]|uniref:Nuclear transport factor 2 family protein n=1 Tax=Undibacterium luofuense TaxID=2828733 RepID=A0A941DMF3_9BURK|nr:nuclear transport factor 2 family protein [Undibacterium luofuense]MBR7783857.1 nuclear transport factor 2 family protein [Undibacterium luofuense]
MDAYKVLIFCQKIQKILLGCQWHNFSAAIADVRNKKIPHNLRKKMYKLLAMLILAGMASSPRYAVARTADSTDKVQIEQVIEAFRTAIVNKDKKAFLQLFLKENITWTGVNTDASIEMMYANRPKPEMKRPSKFFSSSPREFINFVVKEKEKVDETISNVRIDSDGDVGLVWFDYNFVRGSYKQNWGKESWQMVRTSNGWKIAAVTWSQELNPVPPPSVGLK